jgi:hypothetical protein
MSATVTRRRLSVLPLLGALLVALATAEAILADKWAHGWDTAGAAMWGYGGIIRDWLTPEQIAFVAKTYPVVVLSYCPGTNGTTAGGVEGNARALKQQNPAIKVLLYFNVEQWPCYVPTDPAYSTFLAHPEWWLKDDNGNVVQPQRIDPTNEAAADYWMSVPLGQSPDATQVIDGVLADGGATSEPLANVSDARQVEIVAAKYVPAFDMRF